MNAARIVELKRSRALAFEYLPLTGRHYAQLQKRRRLKYRS